MNKKYLSAILFGTLLASSTGTFTSCKDYDDDIKGLQEQIDANKKTLDDKAAALQTALEAAQKRAEDAAAAAAAAQKTADDAAKAAAAASKAAADAQVAAIQEAQRLVNDLRSVVNGKVDQSVYDAKMTTLDNKISAIEGRLDDPKTGLEAINTQLKALNAFKEAIDELDLTTAFPELQGQVEGLISDLGQLLDKGGTIDQIKEQLQTLSDKIDGVSTNVNTLKELLSHRLTSLQFAPTEFVNGIEVINFATLQYKPWTILLADETDGKTTSSINDGKTTAIYYASPSSVKKENIKGLTVLMNNGSNTITRAAEESKITATIAKEIESGKMTVNLRKNSTESFAGTTSGDDNTKENFYLIALKADIQLTDAEVADGVNASVISDWARLAETTSTPYIHNVAYTDDKAQEDFATEVAPHFYPYTTIHDATTVDGVNSTAKKFIIKSLPYTESLDLNTLVDVCDKDGHRFVLSDYNMAFEFNLVDYALKANNEEKTNQKNFATIKDGVITSRANDGTVNNKDAVGREPLIQVVLKNTVNKEVIDVRYFKIAWTSKPVDTNLGTVETFEGDYACTDESRNHKVGTDAMNDKVYTKAKADGISKTEFHELYRLDNFLYESYDAAKAGSPLADLAFGAIEEIQATGDVTTYNLNWNLPAFTASQAEYEAGKAVKTVYGRYTRISDPTEMYIFDLTETLNISKMTFGAGYDQPYWNAGAVLSNTNADKKFQVNPALTSDNTYGITNFFDCQIIADMLKGYNKANVTITAPEDLVAGGTPDVTADFMFDADRVKALLDNDWNVTDNGATLNYKMTKAATIDGGIIRLFEDPIPTTSAHGVATTAAQMLLGKNVPVKLVATNCAGNTEVIDKFLVNFINPLTMALGDVKDTFKDLLTGGSTISVDKIATIKETFGLERIVWENGAEKTPADKLVQWYNVKGVTWDLTKATTNLKKEGNNIIITNDVNASAWSVFKDKYVLTATPSEEGAVSLTFHNNSGAHLQQAIQIAVPVYVKTKWAPVLADPTKKVVVLTVTPGVTGE